MSQANIRVVWDANRMRGDWLLDAPSRTLDDTHALVTAVATALFTHRTALTDDRLPDPQSSDRRGWWADHEAELVRGGWPIGSRLWLISREKQSEETRQRAETYIREALDPFVTLALIDRYDLTVDWFAHERLGAEIVLYRGPRGAIAVRFERLWDELTELAAAQRDVPRQPSQIADRTFDQVWE